MKYVRTEDGIFRIANDKITVINGCQFVLIRYGIFHGLDVKDKLADTIEELCDCFIGVPDREWHKKNLIGTKGVNFFQKPFHLEYKYFDKNFSGLKLKNQNGWEYTAQEWQDKEHNFIMGCIETDKGLIYVSKMNEEGKMELL